MELNPPRLERLTAQPDIQRLLTAFLRNPGPRTFLWAGPEGSGKRSYALALTRNLFCQEGPECGGCATCRQVLARTHPDLFWVDREHVWADDEKERKKTEITVEVVRHLSERLNRAPLSAPWKVAVVPRAQEMNERAQDSFLKTLEEPPERTLILLLAETTGRFRPTVLSRCRLVRFPPLSDPTVEGVLVRDHGWDPGEARKAAREAGGNLVQALRAKEPEWTEFREKACGDLDRALAGPETAWLALASEYEKWEPDILGDEEMTATQRKAKVLEAALQAYSGLWTRRAAGEAPVPKGMDSLEPVEVLACLQHHRDLIPTHLGAKMILDHLFLELREGFREGKAPGRPFAGSPFPA